MLKNVAVIFVPCNKPRRYVKIWAGIALPPSKTMPHLYLACQINHYVVKVRKYCYILKSEKDNKLYIGYTNNLRCRFTEHIKGQVNAIKSRRPLKLIYYEACLNKKKAILREKYFKTAFGRKYLKNRI